MELPANEIDNLIKGHTGALTKREFKPMMAKTEFLDNVTVKTQAAANRVPVVSINNQTVIKGNRINISSSLSVSDLDGDNITKYRVRDTIRSMVKQEIIFMLMEVQ